MSVDRKDLEHTARLALLHLDPERVPELLEQMRRIVALVEQLEELDVDDVPPTKHVIDLVNRERDDEPRASLPVERVAEMAPDIDDGHFVVPRVIPK